jgi:UDP-glucuronate 4-epimerase
MTKKYLITGCAGFIGFHLSKRLLENKNNLIIGIDNINNYYSVKLKNKRLKILKEYKNFIFKKIDISKKKQIQEIKSYINKFDYIIHFAAQAGVRNSVKEPEKYVNSNLLGFFNILEYVRKSKKKLNKFIYASSSSTYGINQRAPFKENLPINKPMSFYAATKFSNELMADSYSRVYNITMIGLRFFTVYGPFGRPDMAVFNLTKDIINKNKVSLVNNGKVYRDFTYIDDIVDGIVNCISLKKNLKDKWNFDNNIFNLGSGKKTSIKKLVYILSKKLNRKIEITYEKKDITDMELTHASLKKSTKLLNYKPYRNLNFGLNKFIRWYLEYFKLNS